ncbi:MAG: AAA family ATPase, partial [Salinirussus sp.]
IIASTNRFDMLDRAILRPGRFDRLIEVPLPDWDARKKILELHTAEMALADDVDLAGLATDTDGFSGAELASLATEAGIFAIRDDRTEVQTGDFEDALEKVTDEDDPAGVPVAFA